MTKSWRTQLSGTPWNRLGDVGLQRRIWCSDEDEWKSGARSRYAEGLGPWPSREV